MRIFWKAAQRSVVGKHLVLLQQVRLVERTYDVSLVHGTNSGNVWSCLFSAAPVRFRYSGEGAARCDAV